MKDLTPEQYKELAAEIEEVGENLALLGLSFVVVVGGRGINHIAYQADGRENVPAILENAAAQVRAGIARKAN